MTTTSGGVVVRSRVVITKRIPLHSAPNITRYDIGGYKMSDLNENFTTFTPHTNSRDAGSLKL